MAGRAARCGPASPPNATGAARYSKVYVVHQYDWRGRKIGTSNPFAAGETPAFTFVTYDLLDRNLVTAHPDDVDFGSVPGGSTLAETDVRAWKQALAAALPGGDASVLIDDSVVSINVTWSDAGDAGNPTTLNLRTQL